MGDSTPLKKILRAKEVAGDVPVLIGSGLDMSNVKHLFPSSDGAIVGASLKYKGIIEGPVSQDRSDNLMKAVRHLR
jgi:predicted TIM-barrel enzyme